MNESEYYAREISNDELDALADAGLYYLDEAGFFLTLSDDELEQIRLAGEQLLNEAKGKI